DAGGRLRRRVWTIRRGRGPALRRRPDPRCARLGRKNRGAAGTTTTLRATHQEVINLGNFAQAVKLLGHEHAELFFLNVLRQLAFNLWKINVHWPRAALAAEDDELAVHGDDA